MAIFPPAADNVQDDNAAERPTDRSADADNNK